MKIVVHIDRIVAEGRRLSRRDRERLDRALREELQQRLARHASPAFWRARGSHADLAAPLEPLATRTPEALGGAVARSIDRAVAPGAEGGEQ